jgi:PAS domain S-box-containing protein
VRATISTRGVEALCLDLAEVMFVALDITGRVTLMNDAGCRLLGYSRDELIGADWFEMILPADQRKRVRTIFKALVTGKGEEYATANGPVVTHSGDVRMIAWNNIALTDGEGTIIGTLSSGRDVTEQHNAELALRASEARLKAIVETAVDGIIIIDEHGVMETVNQATANIFGYTMQEMQGRNVSMLMPPPYKEEHDAYVQKYLRTGEAKIIGIGREVRGRRKDGTIFAMDLAVSEFFIGGRRMFTGLVRDLTERNRMLQQIVHASTEEQQRIGQDLHDGLGQQLTGVAFLSDVLRQQLALDKSPHVNEAREITELVNQAIAHLRALVKGLRPVRLGPEGLMLALKDLVQTTERLFNISCTLRCEQPVLLADVTVASHLYYIAKEAVHNAVRHGHAKRVQITLEKTGRRILLEIADNGSGLPEGVQASSSGGLRIMVHRARMIGGMLEVRRGKRGGVVVSCRVDNLPSAQGSK